VQLLPTALTYKLMALTGVLIFFGTIVTALVGGSEEYWPATWGLVVSLSVERHEDFDQGVSSVPVVYYQYWVGNQRFDGNHEGKPDQIKSTKAILVRYLPFAPWISTVQPGISPVLWIPALVGLFVYFFSFILCQTHLPYSLKASRSKRSS